MVREASKVGLLAAALTVVVACGDAPRPPDADEPMAGQEPAPDAFFDDSDGDGLCDFTEAEANTDPTLADTDRDGFSDYLEFGNFFDPRDPQSPSPDQVARLQAEPGASLTFPVGATVSGEGRALGGVFEGLPSLYDPLRSAADFFVGAAAVSADPGDHVRGIERDSQRFGIVVGETHLGFDLRFAYPDADPAPCSRAYPFRYSVRDDEGEVLQRRQYLLVVGARPSDPDTDPAQRFCPAPSCY